MTTTINLGLKKPDRTDRFRIDDFNENADILDGILQNRIISLSEEEYSELTEKSDDILYVVIDDSGNITQYLGSTPVGGNNGSIGTKLLMPFSSPATDIIGNATVTTD